MTENSSSTLQEKILSLPDVQLRTVQIGSGPDLLMLHGWRDSSKSFQFLFPELSREFRITAIDLPGHGGSSLPPENWDTTNISRTVRLALKELGISKPHCLAHSVGGRVAIRLTLEFPDTFDRLILVDSSGVKPPRPFSYHVKVAIAKVGKYSERYLGSFGAWLKGKIYAKIASRDYAAAGPLRSILVRIVNDDLKPLLSGIKNKTLLVWGERDEETPLSSGTTMSQLIPNSELVVFEGAGHYPFVDQPARFLLTVRRFLRE